jgi:hypothetical protein
MQDRIKVVIVDDEPQSIHRLQDDLATLEDFGSPVNPRV